MRRPEHEFSHAFREHFMTRLDPKAARQAERADAAAREDPIQRARRMALAQGMGEVQGVLDKNLANRKAQIVNPKSPQEAHKILTRMREISEIQALFLEALRRGEIRNLQDERQLMPQFYTFLKRRIEGLKQNPEFAMSNPKSPEYYARLSLARFMRFTPQEAANLKMAMASFAEARRENYFSE